MHNFSIAAIKSNERRTNNRHIKIHVPSCPVLSLLLLLITIGDTMMLIMIGMKKDRRRRDFFKDQMVEWRWSGRKGSGGGEEIPNVVFTLLFVWRKRSTTVFCFNFPGGRRKERKGVDTNYDTRDTLFRFTSSLYYFILFHGCFVLFFVCVPVIAFCKRTEVISEGEEKKPKKRLLCKWICSREGGGGCDDRGSLRLEGEGEMT